MKIFLTGANGQLGKCIQDVMPNDWQLIAKNSTTLDITNKKLVTEAIEYYKPDIIINAAAYTQVDKAEIEQDKAYKVNTLAPSYLAKAAKTVNAKFFHISTDYVFDGKSDKPYVESDPTNPINVYGITKLRGENQVIDVYAENSIIIRTSWVVSEYGNNFVKTMINLAQKLDQLNIINDQFGCPTYAKDIANCIITMIKELSPAGIYHYSGSEQLNWYQFAHKIIDIAYNQGVIFNKPNITGITTDEYNAAAKRPLNSIMSNKKIQKQKVNYTNIDDFIIENISKIKRDVL